MNEKRLDELIEEATIDCYGEDEEFWGFLAMLEDTLNFPFGASVIGERVKVRGMDNEKSFPRRGIMASVERNGRFYTISFDSLEDIQADAQTVEWLAAYQRWASWG
ncbi:MAG: calcium-binding protein [Chloroflexota bacterium]